MDFGTQSTTERNAAIAAGVVAVTAVLSIAYDWGLVMVLPLLAGVGALLVLFLPQGSSGTRLPGSKGSLLLICGIVSAAIFIIMALNYFGWLSSHLATFDALQFLLGLAASLALSWFAWQMLQAEGGRLQIGTASPAGTSSREDDDRP
jgi:hypothetical protein